MLTTKAELEELFLRRKPIKLLMALKIGGHGTSYISSLSKETDCTYSHTVKLLEIFRSLGIVEFNKQGRVKYIKLTPEGEEIASAFEAVLRKFSKLKKMEPKKPVLQQQPITKQQKPYSN
jgi:DNA-binding transcriptional ArsR family regulator